MKTKANKHKIQLHLKLFANLTEPERHVELRSAGVKLNAVYWCSYASNSERAFYSQKEKQTDR